MPNLLFICYEFPPSTAVGALRGWHIAKYLRRRGWDVTVLTPQRKVPGAIEVSAMCRTEGIRIEFIGSEDFTAAIRSRYERLPNIAVKAAAKLDGLLGRIGLNGSERWALSLIRTIRKFNAGKWDSVLVSGSPFFAFIAARLTASRLGIPYVLDYRDPWSRNPIIRRAPVITRAAEKWCLRKASGVITVSESWASGIQQEFNLAIRPSVVHNGYDEDAVVGIEPTKFPETALVYAGAFYRGQRDIHPVLKAMKAAIAKKTKPFNTIRLHYFGNEQAYVQRVAELFGMTEHVVLHGRASRERVWAALAGASAAVVIAGNADRFDLWESGIIPAKLFEPMAVGTRILLIAPPESDAAQIVNKTGAGRSFRALETEEIADWINALQDYKSPMQRAGSRRFTWASLSSRLDEVLRNIVEA
jgi:hypothetical protein